MSIRGGDQFCLFEGIAPINNNSNPSPIFFFFFNFSIRDALKWEDSGDIWLSNDWWKVREVSQVSVELSTLNITIELDQATSNIIPDTLSEASAASVISVSSAERIPRPETAP